MAFVDIDKAFDRVLREVVWWAQRYLGVDEWIVSVIKAMYKDASTKVRLNERVSERERVGLSMLRLGCIRAQFSAHCYSSLCWRLCQENSWKAYLWNCFMRMILF